MKRQHQHAWVMTSPHPFGAVQKYKCTSCAATYEERRGSYDDRMADVERRLGFRP